MDSFHEIEATPQSGIVRCDLCELVQTRPAVGASQTAVCVRCGARLYRDAGRRLYWTRCFALAALALYVPANLLPIAVVDYLGAHSKMTILNGVAHLFSAGMYLVGLLVCTTSFLTPLAKIVGLLFLSFAPPGRWALRGRRRAYDLIHAVSSWNAMEMFLLASILALANFGDIATIVAGAGAWAFTAVFVLTTAASASFDASTLWQRDDSAFGTEHASA